MTPDVAGVSGPEHVAVRVCDETAGGDHAFERGLHVGARIRVAGTDDAANIAMRVASTSEKAGHEQSVRQETLQYPPWIMNAHGDRARPARALRHARRVDLDRAHQPAGKVTRPFGLPGLPVR